MAQPLNSSSSEAAYSSPPSEYSSNAVADTRSAGFQPASGPRERTNRRLLAQPAPTRNRQFVFISASSGCLILRSSILACFNRSNPYIGHYAHRFKSRIGGGLNRDRPLDRA
jgi:hypothetical protein